MEWPRISLVTPVYNQAAWIAGCIDSVLSQDYPNLEYMVIDGGSTDGTAEIVQRYAGRLSWWVSEKDRGQGHAINKGLTRATGEVVNWLGGDDRLRPGALAVVGRMFAERPEIDVLVGQCEYAYVEEGRRETSRTTLEEIGLIPCTNPIAQPSCFFRRGLLRETPIDESYHYAMDTELWCYLLSRGAKWEVTDAVLSEYLMTGVNKTMTGGRKILAELERLYRQYSRERVPMYVWTGGVMHRLEKFARRHAGTWRERAARAAFAGVGKGVGRVYRFDRMYAMLATYRYFDGGEAGR